MRISDWSSDVCSSDLLLRVAPGAANDPVMCFDHRIRSRRGPFNDADRHDRAAPHGPAVTQAIGEVALTRPPYPGDPMPWTTGNYTIIGVLSAQELAPGQQPVRLDPRHDHTDPAPPKKPAYTPPR